MGVLNISALERRTVSVKEFAEIVGISRSMAYELIAENRVRYLRIHTRIVITKSAIDEFLEGRGNDQQQTAK
jgi:excisionase family DNA binding protein